MVSCGSLQKVPMPLGSPAAGPPGICVVGLSLPHGAVVYMWSPPLVGVQLPGPGHHRLFYLRLPAQRHGNWKRKSTFFIHIQIQKAGKVLDSREWSSRKERPQARWEEEHRRLRS